MELGEKDFSELPLAEVNEYLIRLVGQIPTIAAGSEGKTRDESAEHFQETYLRRRSSETMKRLKADLERMNGRAKVATEAGKQYLVMAFEEAYSVGSRGLISWLIDEVNQDPAGFYSEDVDTVCEIERKGYKRFSSQLLNHSAYLEKKFGKGIEPNNFQVVLSANWRRQFIERYHNEP